MKKAVYLLVTTLWLASLAGTYLATMKFHHHPTPPLTNNVLRWVRDPVVGTQYYGWYEADGSAFNAVGTAGYNNRMGATEEPKNVPVHMWERVN